MTRTGRVGPPDPDASDFPDVSVVTSGHDVADARLHRVVRALQRRGLTVEVLGLGDPAGGPAGARVRAVPRGGMLARAALAPRLAARARGRVVLALDPDSLLAARAVGAARRRPVVADVHEDYAALLSDRRWARRFGGLPGSVARVLVGAATRAAATASVTAVADDHIPPLTAIRRLVVRNDPDLGLLGEPAPLDAEPRAVYVGDVRASRGLFAMLDAVAAAPGWTLEVIGPVREADDAALRARLADPALGPRVRLHGRRPPTEAWLIGRGAWVGFALLSDTPAFRDAVPSKLHEYLAAGVVPVVSDLPRQREFVERSGAGLVVADADEAGSVLRHLAAHPEELAHRREAALAWTRDRATRTGYDDLADAVEGVLARG